MKKVLSVLLALSIIFLCGCANSSPKKDDNVIAKLGSTSGVNGDTLEMKFDKQKVNTVVIQEKEATECTVTIFDSSDNIIYRQKNATDYKYCAFKTVETEGIKIKIEDSDYDIKSVKAYYDKDKADDDFRVTTYVVADRILDKKNLDSKSFDTITDVILFSCVSFDEKGNVFLNDINKKSGEQVITTALENLKSVIGKRDVNIYVNILGPDADEGIEDWNDQMDNKAKKHTSAFKSGKMEAQIYNIVTKYGFDGVFFDYEFPIKSKHWKPFNKFLVSLDKELPKKVIGLALADWDVKLSKDAINAVDMIEMMQYDLFDDRGDHASLEAAKSGIEKFIDKGIDPKKLDLGVPFYGRPTDKGAFWYDYSQYAEGLGLYENKAYITEQNVEAYFNSYQLIYDKTALAMDYGIGGMMIWHYSCDYFNADHPELSLFGAMNTCIKDRG